MMKSVLIDERWPATMLYVERQSNGKILVLCELPSGERQWYGQDRVR